MYSSISTTTITTTTSTTTITTTTLLGVFLKGRDNMGEVLRRRRRFQSPGDVILRELDPCA